MLISLIATALNSNLDLLMSLQRIEMSRQQVNYFQGARLPFVTAGPAVGLRRFGRYTMDADGNITTDIKPGKIVPEHLPDFYVGFRSFWEVDIYGKLKNKKKAALARYLSGVERRNWLVTNLIAVISGAYYELLSLDNELDIIRQTNELQQNALDIVRVQKEAAAANELAVQQVESTVLNSRNLEVGILIRIREAENKMNLLLGRYPQAIVRNKDAFFSQLAAQIPVCKPSDLLKNWPDIRQVELEVQASKADLLAARAAFYPSLSITGNVGLQAFNPSVLFDPKSLAYGLFAGLTGPVFNKSVIKADFGTANAMQQEALYHYQKSIINGYTEVNNEIANIRDLQRSYDLISQQVEVLNRSIETSNELFSRRRANYLEVLLAKKSALEAKVELVDTKRQQYYSFINMYKALGGGWR